MWASNGSSAFVGGTVRDSESALQSIGQYIEDYLDLVENVPNEIVRSITLLHEKSHMYHKLVDKLERTLAKVTSDPQPSDSRNGPGQSSHSGLISNSGHSSNSGLISNSVQSKESESSAEDEERRRKRFEVIQKYLVAIQSISDEKLYIVQSIYEQLELKARQLDHDVRSISLGSGNSFISPIKSAKDVRGYFNSFNDRHSHMNGNHGNNGNSGSIGSESSPENNSSEENGSQDAVSDNANESGGRRESRVHHVKNSSSGTNSKNNNGTNSLMDQEEEENDADSESPVKERKRTRRTKNSNSRGREEESRDGHHGKNESRDGHHGKSETRDGHHGKSDQKNEHSSSRGGKKRGKCREQSGVSSQHNTSSTHHSISKKSRKRGSDSPSFLDDVDPDEPTYCLCNQISYGEMIGCDNSNCHIEWFHFSCVQLTTKPKGKWFCPACRGDRSNIQRK